MSYRIVDVRHAINAMYVESVWRLKALWKFIRWRIQMRGISHVVFAAKHSGTTLVYCCTHDTSTPMNGRSNVTIAKKVSWIWPAWKCTRQSIRALNVTCVTDAAIDIPPIRRCTNIATPERIPAPWCQYRSHWKFLNLKTEQTDCK